VAIVDENSNIPLYIQLKKSIKDHIISLFHIDALLGLFNKKFETEAN
jgi:archaellum component FlaD/FlaE